ncbi:hypothetical protein AAFF_G00429410 [Aldrovandia affinis]|uniref:Uncharacterized protein n=1 Tax=Aldrovandia affinis TaxID=143900 RepID=A0AAD7R359_9TELE|nr:hypothetical protein AAFF_G00429410 [Aldrovandia affinis]
MEIQHAQTQAEPARERERRTKRHRETDTEKLYCRLTICSNGAVHGYSPADLRALHTLFLPLSSVSLCEHTEELD